MSSRPDKNRYYCNIAQMVGTRSTCLRRRYGAVIVKNDSIISTGYNGAPRGMPNCVDLGVCLRNQLASEKGTDYSLCCSVHAEQNAITCAARENMIGATIYIVGINVEDGTYADPSPCIMCSRMILNAGVSKAYGINQDGKIVPIDISLNGIEDIQAKTIMKVVEKNQDLNRSDIIGLLQTRRDIINTTENLPPIHY